MTRRAAAGPGGPGRRLGLAPAPAPARATAPARAAAAAGSAPAPGRVGLLEIRPDRLEDDVEVAGHAEPRPDRGDVEVMRAEVLDHRDAVVQQGLDVDQVPGPAFVLEHATADRVAIGPAGLGASRTIQVVRVGRPDHPLLIHRLGLGGAVVVQRDQDLAQFDPAIGPDHHGLAATERPAAVRRCSEPPHIAHHAVSDQVRRIAHRPAPPTARFAAPPYALTRLLSDTNPEPGTRPPSQSPATTRDGRPVASYLDKIRKELSVR